jgi:DNA-binding winged helix-turn-helix (wHTH) protein/tetratricopeptide (TPR) repeat protein
MALLSRIPNRSSISRGKRDGKVTVWSQSGVGALGRGPFIPYNLHITFSHRFVSLRRGQIGVRRTPLSMVSANDSGLRFGSFEIPDEVDLLYRDGAVVPLAPRAVRVLRYLASNPRRVVPKDELLENVWSDVFTTDGVLKKAVSQIRRALGDHVSSPRFVRTWHKRGYELVVPAERTAPRALGGHGRFSEIDPSNDELVPDYEQFAGRSAQMAELRAELAIALGDGPTRPVLIAGEAGIGKTSLARRFGDWAESRGVVQYYGRFFRLREAPFGPHQLFIDLLSAAMGEKNLPSLLRRIEEHGVLLPPELSAAETSAIAGSDPARLEVSIASSWLAIARKRPVLLILDDLQWADEASLETIGCLIRMLGSEPMMILLLVTTGDEGLVRTWLDTHALQRSYTTLTLPGLDRQACREVIGAVFNARRSGEIPPIDIDKLFDLTGGNPYFLLETLRKLVANGVVVPGIGRWSWEGIEDLSLPGSLVTASTARLTNVSEDVSRLIEQAAVIGDEFSLATLAALSELPEERVESLLSDAVSRDILTTQDVSRGEDYRFHHTILRHVVHQGISPGRRRRLHRAVAGVLEATTEPDRVAGALAEHYAAAGDDRPGFFYSLRAWRMAADRSAWLEALTLVQQAESAAASLRSADSFSNRDQLKLDLARGETLFSGGRNQEALEDLQRAALVARQEGDSGSLARSLLLGGQAHVAMGHYGEASASFTEALSLYSTAEDSDGRCRVLLHLAAVENALGHYEAAGDLVDEVLSSRPGAELAALGRGTLGWSLALRGELSRARPLLEQAIGHYDRTGNRRERSSLLRRLHWIDLSSGRYESAIETAIRAREDSIAIGDIRGEAKANLGIGQARIAQGLYVEGISFLNRTLEKLQISGDAHCEAEALWLLGRARRETGELNDAADLITRAIDMIREIGDEDDEFRMLLDRSGLELAQNRPADAAASAESARTIARQLRNDEGTALADLQLAMIELSSGDVSTAATTAERAVAVLERIGSSERWRAWSVLGRARRCAGDATAARVALEQSVSLVDAIREQIPPSDLERRLQIALSRGEPARELGNLLSSEGLTEEAARLGAKWP